MPVLFFTLKILAILTVMVIFSLPFFPSKFSFSLAHEGYDKPRTWRNLAFVFESGLVGFLILCVAPLIKNLLHRFFALKWIKFLVDRFVGERIEYCFDVLVVIASNLVIIWCFLIVKRIVRALLDKLVYNETRDSNKKDKKRKQKKDKNKKKDERDTSEKRLRRLRADSVIKPKGDASDKEVKTYSKEYIKKKAQASDTDGKKKKPSQEEDDVSFLKFIKLIWFSIVGIFYEEEDEHEYLKVRAYRFSRELKIFLYLIAAVYLIALALMLVPIFFKLEIAGQDFIYTVCNWLVVNTYVYPMISIVILFEAVWFLSGECRKPREAETDLLSFVNGTNTEKKIDFLEIKKSILDKHGENYKINCFKVDGAGGNTGTPSDKECIKNIHDAIRSIMGKVDNDYLQGIEKMLEGEHVLFDSSLYSALGTYIIQYLFVTLAFGNRALFVCSDKNEVEKALEYLNEGFKSITKTSQVLWRITTREKMHKGQTPDILLVTPEHFLDNSIFVDGAGFFDELSDVFVLDVDKIIPANNYYCLIMSKLLERGTLSFNERFDEETVEKRIRYSFLANGFVLGLNNSICQFFGIATGELNYFRSSNLASSVETFVWNKGTNPTLYVDNGASQVSLELQIAKEACNMGIEDVTLISESAVYGGQLGELPSLNFNRYSFSDVPYGYVIVADNKFNLPNTIYNYSRYSGHGTSMLHIVSRPYLLRDYFNTKAEKYASSYDEYISETMSEHADPLRSQMIALLCDAIYGIEICSFMERASELLGEEYRPDEPSALDRCISACLNMALNTQDSDLEPKYSSRTRINSELESKKFIVLKNYDDIFAKLLEGTETVKLKYANSNSDEHISVFRREIAQSFIPGQVLAHNNRSFTVKALDAQNGVLTLDDTGATVNVPSDYIQTRHYKINGVENCKTINANSCYHAETSVVSRVDFKTYDASVSVDTVGYYAIEEGLQTINLKDPNFARNVSLDGNGDIMAQLHRDINTRIMLVEITADVEYDNSTAYTLAVILQELMRTRFPHQHRSISVCPVLEGDVEGFLAKNPAIRDLYPRLVDDFGKTAAEVNPVAPEAEGEGESKKPVTVKAVIIEDIEGGNGVIDTLADANGLLMLNTLHLIADFLKWSESTSGQEFNYLNFGYDELPELFNLGKLDEIMRQFRQDIAESRIIRRDSEELCFFCHSAKDELQVLSDERRMCPDCVKTPIDTFDKLDGVFAEVIKALTDSTSVADTMPKDVKIDFVSSKELVEYLEDIRFDFEKNELPIALCNRTKRIIYLEYGLPRVSAIASIARIIAELWQDANVKNDGSPIFAGQLDYVEIQALWLLKLTADAEAFEEFYRTHEGLTELKLELAKLGSRDSFAYLLGEKGKDSDDDSDDGDDGSIVIDRVDDPEATPKYFYNMLSDEEKRIYEKIEEAVKNCEPHTEDFTVSVDCARCSELVTMVKYDHPEIFWCQYVIGTVIKNSSTGCAKNVILNYVMDKKEIERRQKQISRAVKDFMKGINTSMSDYEVALRAHENIIERIDYDSIGLDEQDRDSSSYKKPDNLRSIYGVFVEKKAVCAGYAFAFQYLLRCAGIESAYVVGPCHSGGLHAWSMVKLEGDYYYVDVTFDDASNTDEKKNHNEGPSYDYFCITSEELYKSRKLDNPEWYPECTATKCNYFVRSGLLLKSYDTDKLTSGIRRAYESGKDSVSFKFENEQLYRLACRRLFDNGEAFDVLQAAGCKMNNYRYRKNDELYTVRIFFKK
ncbi:MAG: hypothetical protein IJP16_04685 [Clostridia bacterium]|nr:hypothetical protein [Clostridia bacterium]